MVESLRMGENGEALVAVGLDVASRGESGVDVFRDLDGVSLEGAERIWWRRVVLSVGITDLF